MTELGIELNDTSTELGIEQDDTSIELGIEASVSAISYNSLLDKPSIEGITLQGNKTASDLGLAKSSDIPTKTSDLTNDSGYITSSYHDSTKQDTLIAGENITITNNVISASGGTGNVDDVKVNGTSVVSNKIANVSVPTSTSDLTNDSGYITKSVNDLTNYTKTSELSSVATSGSYNDLSNKPTIPTKTSQLTNDSGFITSSYHDATKQDVISDLATIRSGASLGATSIQPNDNVSELVNDAGYLTQHQSLDDYDTKSEVNTKISNATNDMATQTWVGQQGYLTEHQSLANYYNKTETDNLLDEKENADATILKQANVVNNVVSTSTNMPLSANMGKELQTQISNLKNIGRFLAIWNATTGVPTSEPTTSPYTYHTGDYFRIGVVGNRIPANTTYVVGGTNWTTTTDTLSIGDVYYFDGTTWNRQASSGGGAVQDVQQNGVSVLDGGIANVVVPTKTSDITNDSGFITKQVGDLVNYSTTTAMNTAISNHHDATKQDLIDSTHKLSYSLLSNTPTIPITTSQLTNNSGFITNSVNNLTNYTLTSDLGDLALKDSASGTFTPSGSVSTPTITITPTTTNVNSITAVGTLPSHASDTFTQGSFTQGTFSQGTLPTWSASVSNEILSFSFSQGTLPTHASDSFTKPTFTQGTFSAGTLPTKSANQSVVSGIQSATSSQPTFTGNEGSISVQ